MPITKHILGTTKEGVTVTVYEIENKNGLKASFSDLGAVWLRMFVPDKKGALSDVLLGYEDPDVLYENPGALGAIVGRNANRIGGAKFSLNGKSYELFPNDHGSNLHSGPELFGKRLFDVETGSREEGEFVSFRLESPEGDQGYPGSLFVEVRYTLTEQNELQIEYRLKAGKEDTIANLTNHAYFNLAGHQSGDILSQKLWIDADAFTEADEHCLTTGKVLSVENTPFDFRSPKKIGRDMDLKYKQLENGRGYDHNFCLNGADGALRLAAAAEDEASGRRMEVLTNLPGMQLYTGNWLDKKIPAKDGAHYAPYAGFALETQFYPNAINVPEWEQPVIRAGEEKHYVTVYRFLS